MILWFYSNKCILVFLHLLIQGSWNPFNFPGGASFVLMRWLWVGSWITPGWGLLTRKPDLGLEAWGFQPHLHPPGRGRGWRLGECLSRPREEAFPAVPTAGQWESFLAVDTSTCWGGGTPASWGQSCWPRPGDSSSPGHSYTSFIASCNRPVNIKLAFPWILWAVLANNWVQGAGGHGNFWSAVKWDRVVGHLGTSEWLPPEAGCLVDLSPYPGGHRALQKSVKTELNGGMPRWHHMSGVGGWGDECVHRAKETQEGEKNWGFFFLQG